MQYWTEVDLDFVDQISARAEYTVLFFGPPRVRMLSPIEKAIFSVKTSGNDFFNAILNIARRLSPQLEVIGAAQGISFSQVRNRSPMSEIGSERPVILTSPITYTQATISRLFIPYDNLLKKATKASWIFSQPDLGGVDVNFHRFETLFPFGVGIVMSNEVNATPVARLYMEGCKSVGFASQVNAGDIVILETVQIVGHRIVRLDSAQE